MVSMPSELRNAVVQGVQPAHEEWGGTPLRMTSLYGIRVYGNGSTLAMHVDRASTRERLSRSLVITVTMGHSHTDFHLTHPVSCVCWSAEVAHPDSHP